MEKIEALEKVITAEKEGNSEAMETLDNERVEKGILVMEVNRVRIPGV